MTYKDKLENICKRCDDQCLYTRNGLVCKAMPNELLEEISILKEKLAQAEKERDDALYKAEKYDTLVDNNIQIENIYSIFDNSLMVKIDYSDLIKNNEDTFHDMIIEKILHNYRANNNKKESKRVQDKSVRYYIENILNGAREQLGLFHNIYGFSKDEVEALESVVKMLKESEKHE